RAGLAEAVAGVAELAAQLVDRGGDLEVAASERAAEAAEHVEALAELVAGAPAGGERHALLALVALDAGDAHEADLARARAVRAAAGRAVEVADLDHAHVFGDLGIAAQLDRRELRGRGEERADRQVVVDHRVAELLGPREVGLGELLLVEVDRAGRVA